MRGTFTLLMLTLVPLATVAQRHLEIGVSPLVTHYHGDLGNYDRTMQWNGLRPGVQVTFRDFLNNPKRYVTRSLTCEGRISWFRVGYDERAPIKGMDVKELKNYGRGLSFRNDLVGASGHLVLNAYREPFTPLFQQRFYMTFQIGLGIYHGRPKADLFRGDIALENRYYSWRTGELGNAPASDPDAEVVQRDGVYETDLYSWMTEGGTGATESGRTQRISPWHVGVPMGAGIRYMLTKQMSVGMEFSYIMFMDDMIDDVSDRYATFDEIDAAYVGDPVQQALARYISDPTGRGSNGTPNPVFTSPRGNPGLLDSVSFLSFELSYKFKRRPGRRSYVSI
jgi:hypothetical protein